jgi:peroxiredoxin
MRNVLLILAITFIWSCASQEEQNNFTIKGTIANGARQQVFLETVSFKNIGGGTPTVISTATADANGKFAFEGELAERQISQVRVAQSMVISLSLFNENIEIQADLKKPGTHSVTGSRETTVLNNFFAKLKNDSQLLNALQPKLNQALQKKDVETLQQISKEQEQLRAAFYEDMKNFVDTTSCYPSAFTVIQNLDMESERKFITAFANRMVAEIPNSKYTKELVAKLAQKPTKKPQQSGPKQSGGFIGNPAPEIAVNDPNGNLQKLSDLKGKVVLIDFWASWCRPCRHENPNVVKTYNEYKDKGFTVFSVSLDNDKARWVKAIADDKLAWSSHVSELNKFNAQAVRDYSVRSIPSTFLVNREGIIVAQNLRGPALEKKVAELMDN